MNLLLSLYLYNVILTIFIYQLISFNYCNDIFISINISFIVNQFNYFWSIIAAFILWEMRFDKIISHMMNMNFFKKKLSKKREIEMNFFITTRINQFYLPYRASLSKRHYYNHCI